MKPAWRWLTAFYANAGHPATCRVASFAAWRGFVSRQFYDPVEAPVNYGRLSNREFARDVKDKYGFDPGV